MENEYWKTKKKEGIIKAEAFEKLDFEILHQVKPYFNDIISELDIEIWVLAYEPFIKFSFNNEVDFPRLKRQLRKFENLQFGIRAFVGYFAFEYYKLMHINIEKAKNLAIDNDKSAKQLIKMLKSDYKILSIKTDQVKEAAQITDFFLQQKIHNALLSVINEHESIKDQLNIYNEQSFYKNYFVKTYSYYKFLRSNTTEEKFNNTEIRNIVIETLDCINVEFWNNMIPKYSEKENYIKELYKELKFKGV